MWIWGKDQGREDERGKRCDACLTEWAGRISAAPGAEAVRISDVRWNDNATGQVRGAFEVEHNTWIYTGIVRLLDVA